MFDDIDLWDILKKDYRDLVFSKIPRYISRYLNIVDCVSTLKADLFINYVGFLPDEKVAMAAFKTCGKSSLLLKHSIGGNTETLKWYERMNIDYISVCSQPSQLHTQAQGICKRSFVLRDHKFTGFASKAVLTRHELCSSLKIADNRKIITLATTRHSNYIFAAHNRDDLSYILAHSVLPILEKRSDCDIVIKLHPQEEPRKYKDYLFDVPPHLLDRIHVVSKINLYSLLRESIAVLTPGSSVVYETMLFEKPVIILDFLKLPDGRPFTRHNAAFCARSSSEIIANIDMIMNAGFNNEGMRTNQKHLLEEICNFNKDEHRKDLHFILDQIVKQP